MNKIIILATLVYIAQCQYLDRNSLLEVQLKNLTASKIGSIGSKTYATHVSQVKTLF